MLPELVELDGDSFEVHGCGNRFGKLVLDFK